ncbi:MAG TPA: glycosyltransferase family 2 protein [Bacteroidales bacterium]|nr:glycosyltransferase family 2 protein [Bacteroidales bacterium]
MTDLSIIIVSFRGYGRLKQCLDSLKKLSGKILKTEVIIVNNCSGDDIFYSMEEHYPGFRFIDNKINGGYSNGCNLGASYATGKYFLILNPDTVVTEDALEGLVSTAGSNPSFIITSCRQVNESGRENVAWGPFPEFKNLTGFMRAVTGSGYKSQKKMKQGFSSQFFFPDWVSGSVILISNEDYVRLNGFDEDFWMYYEDVDLCRRARELGGEVAFCTDILIEHNHGGSSRFNKKTAALTKAEVIISKHLYISKHKEGINKLMIQTFLIFNNLISFGLLAFVGVIFFFIPKLFLRTLIYLRILDYYIGSILKRHLVSPRSVNNRK